MDRLNSVQSGTLTAENLEKHDYNNLINGKTYTLHQNGANSYPWQSGYSGHGDGFSFLFYCQKVEWDGQTDREGLYCRICSLLKQPHKNLKISALKKEKKH